MQNASSQSPPAGRQLERTKHAGIFKRGGRYVVVYRDPSGRQRKRAARTLAEARALKSSLTTDVARGEWRQSSGVRFDGHWRPWLDAYAGRTSRGFRETTRDDYRRDLEAFAAPFFGRMRLAEIEPAHVKRFLSKMANDGYAAGTIRNALAPLRAMLADAAEDGIIRSNPAAGVRIPSGARRADGRRKQLTPDELKRLREKLISEDDRLFVDFLVATGLRVSEALALDWRDLDLSTRRLRVTRRLYRGMDAPKSETSRRAVRLSEAMVARLDALHARRGASQAAPVFPSPRGSRMNYANAYNRILKPAMRTAGIEYGAFHRLRHTTGTELRRRGAALDEVQLHLGHHDLAFTRRVYVHTGDDDGPDPAILDDLTGCAPASQRRLRVVPTDETTAKAAAPVAGVEREVVRASGRARA
jgi:integrase